MSGASEATFTAPVGTWTWHKGGAGMAYKRIYLTFDPSDMTFKGRYDAPGPGTWERDISHCSPSATPVFRRIAAESMRDAYRQAFAEFGTPLDTMDIRFVHGKMYRRLVPLVGADSERPPPPAPVLWLAVRLHPELRRRERTARRLWVDRPFIDVIGAWERTERHEWVAANRAA